MEAIPDWMNVVLLQNAIRSYKNNDCVEITDFLIKSAFSEHIASTMFQCSIDFKSPSSKRETLNVVIKAKPTSDDEFVAIASKGPVFENEINIYTSTIPAFHQFFDRFGIKIDMAPE